MNIDVEYANAAPANIHRRLELAFRGAPPEIRRSVGLSPYPGGKASQQATPPQSRRAAKPAQRYVGWVCGTVAPGISRPALSPKDGERLPEQFTDAAFESITRQAQQAGSQIDLRLTHEGRPIVVSPKGLTLRVHKHPLIGTTFEARLPEGELAERVFEVVGSKGCGVSIGFRGAKLWHVVRSGAGRIRVVNDCRIDHLALIDVRDGGLPAYDAAHAFAVRSTAVRCPDDLRREADAFAWQVIKQQHGVAT